MEGSGDFFPPLCKECLLPEQSFQLQQLVGHRRGTLHLAKLKLARSPSAPVRVATVKGKGDIGCIAGNEGMGRSGKAWVLQFLHSLRANSKAAMKEHLKASQVKLVTRLFSKLGLEVPSQSTSLCMVPKQGPSRINTKEPTPASSSRAQRPPSISVASAQPRPQQLLAIRVHPKLLGTYKRGLVLGNVHPKGNR